MVLVGQQREVQRLATVEPLDGVDGVGRDAHHHGAGGLVVGRAVADAAGLGRAPGRVGARIEVEDQRAPGEVPE
jgi:hypothetical protein